MLTKLKEKWIGVSEEGLFEAVAGCLTLGAGLKTSEFSIDDVRIDKNSQFINDGDAGELYIHTVTI